ncbi:MAG: PIN domain-containing protein [Candidatus Omnitrophica bacterium]|nr:PIN domain-containing protein [Candidatus Omnitrophota bacterium]MBU4478056.1 PIN domain-containing protein [Candidatus Omnitrophota bacterium]
MGIKIFVDTSAFVALFDKKDQYHQKATTYFFGLGSNLAQLHTSNYVIDETITRIRIQDGHKAAVEFTEHFFRSKIFYNHYVNEDIERNAFEFFKKYADKELSFTDCTSFALMKQLRITKAFTFDDDFAKAGFEIVNPF